MMASDVSTPPFLVYSASTDTADPSLVTKQDETCGTQDTLLDTVHGEMNASPWQEGIHSHLENTSEPRLCH